MEINIASMKPWQSKILNFTARLVGIRHEDAYVMTITQGETSEKIKAIAMADDKELETYEGDAYCPTCKDMKKFVGKILISDSGRRMAKGTCPQCNNPLARILGRA